MATRREQMLEMLRAEGQRARRQQMPEQSEPDFWEQTLGVAGNAAPVVGSVLGGVIGGLAGGIPTGGAGAIPGIVAGSSIGGGVGQGVGALLGMGADHMRSEREKMDREAEELEMQRMAKRQALLSLL